MSDRERLESVLSNCLGRSFRIESQRSLNGGCINEAALIEDSKDRFFLKANEASFHAAFEAEAEALRELASTKTVRVPEAIATLTSQDRSYLILEYIEMRPLSSGDWEALGRQLAALHGIKQACYGWVRDNVIGSTPQLNPRADDWVCFFRESRLAPMIRRCESRGFSLPQAQKLLERVPDFLDGHSSRPSLLHGDLWSGNASFDASGNPVLFDPASYYGDRETDLAFTEFFGGFPPRFYEAYQECLPLDPGYSQRKILYNLYHCLNHAYLFGSSYATQATRMSDELLA